MERKIIFGIRLRKKQIPIEANHSSQILVEIAIATVMRKRKKANTLCFHKSLLGEKQNIKNIT